MKTLYILTLFLSTNIYSSTYKWLQPDVPTRTQVDFNKLDSNRKNLNSKHIKTNFKSLLDKGLFENGLNLEQFLTVNQYLETKKKVHSKVVEDEVSSGQSGIKKLGDGAISSSAQNQIDRMLENRKPTVKYNSLNEKISEAKDLKKITEILSKKENNIEEKFLTNFSITVSEMIFSKGVSGKLFDYLLIPAFDRNERLEDSSTGEIGFNLDLKNTVGKTRIKIVKEKYVDLSTDVVFENETDRVNLPLVSIDNFNSFLNKYNLKAIGGNLLVETSGEVIDADIDSNYEAKIYLDKSLKILKTFENANFILFVGTDPGNTELLLRVSQKKNDATVSKFINLQENEIFYENSDLYLSGILELELYEQHAFGKFASDLMISENDVTPLDLDTSIEMLGGNYLQIITDMYISGESNYLKINRERFPIYLGVHHSKAILPSYQFVDNVYNYLGVDDLVGHCLVQISFSKDIIDLTLDSVSEENYLEYDLFFLNTDGTFSENASELATTAFIYGRSVGMFYGNINYLDGKEDFVTSYCADGMYLVEQY